MSPSFMKKTMVYLGLLDDEYDEYDDLEDRAPRGFSAATRVEPRSQDQDPEPAEAFSGGMSRVRTIPRESAQPSQQSRSTPSNVAPAPDGRAGRAGRPDHEPDRAGAVAFGPGARGGPVAVRRRQGDRRPPEGQPPGDREPPDGRP